MIKILSVVWLATLIFQIHADDTGMFESNGTESYFLSPHSLGKTPEMDWSLDKLRNQLKVQDINYTSGSSIYKLTNVTINVIYNDARQETNIPKNDYVEVVGGRVEFTYNFNYSRIGGGSDVKGYGYGSVLSDNLTYHKELAFCEGFICWRVPPSQSKHDLTISTPMTVKRINPLLNQTDKHHIEQMLFNATSGITPSTVRQQVLFQFNNAFPAALNDSLNHQIFGRNIDYSFHSDSHGQMKMTIIRKPYDFGVNPSSGYRVIFVTEILNYDEPLCNTTVPQTPDSFELHGGSQNFQLNCVYESIVQYMHKNKWLDTILNYKWQCDIFQFYAGDLFDMINNLYLTFSPRAILDGQCIAQKDGLKIYADRQFDVNVYTLDVKYKCSITGNNKEGSTIEVLKFTVGIKLHIKAEAKQVHLDFTIVNTEIVDLTFQAAGQYVVSNMQLAKFKANKIISQLKNTKTFGSGFPTLARDIPKTLVSKDYVLYYDPSHKEPTRDILLSQ